MYAWVHDTPTIEKGVCCLSIENHCSILIIVGISVYIISAKNRFYNTISYKNLITVLITHAYIR